MELAEFAHVSSYADRMQLRQTRRAPAEPRVRNGFDWQSVPRGDWGTQVQPTEHCDFGSPPPSAGGEHNQNMRPIMGLGQHNAATWPQDRYWQQSGVKVRTGCPANCEVCRFGGHL
mmetsp:Transcript_51858/g.100220  ORF Transcript_51858/g.100220 Transcript_51858/m.100220 type:complete len:116 (-) Transcript_51858:130-477(-)